MPSLLCKPHKNEYSTPGTTSKTFFLSQRDGIAKQVVLSQLYSHPDLEIHPDLLYAVRSEAGFEGLEVSDVINEIIDGYLTGEFDRMQRRKHARRKLKNATENVDNGRGQISA